MNREVPEKVKYVNDMLLGIGGERVEIYSLPLVNYVREGKRG